METYQVELKGAEAEQIGCRSRLYSLLSSGFRFPSAEIYEGAKTGKFAAEIQAVITNLPYAGLTAGELGRATGLSCEEFQSNYIGLFEVGNNDGPPCFLYEGEYAGGGGEGGGEGFRVFPPFFLLLIMVRK